MFSPTGDTGQSSAPSCEFRVPAGSGLHHRPGYLEIWMPIGTVPPYLVEMLAFSTLDSREEHRGP